MICIKRRNQVIIAVRNSGTDDELQQEHVGQQTQEPHQEVRKRNQSNERTMDAGFCFKKTITLQESSNGELSRGRVEVPPD